MNTGQQIRQHRATVARILLSLYEADALDEPEQWTFERLAQLPSWCLLQDEERTRIQVVSGAVVLAPKMDRWINGATFQAASACVGQPIIESLLDEVSGLGDDSGAQEPEPHADQVTELIRATGASVLHSSLDSWMPVDRLTATLDSNVERIDRAVALAVLHKANTLIASQSSHP